MLFGSVWFAMACALRISAQDLVSKGKLRADQVARTLVPALLEKADKVSRGKVQRTASRNLNLAGVQELGFLLGQSYLLAKRYINILFFVFFVSF